MYSLTWQLSLDLDSQFPGLVARAADANVGDLGE